MLAKQRCFTGCFTAVDPVNTFADVVGNCMYLLCLDAHMPSFEERFVIGF